MAGSDTFYCTSYGVGNELNWISSVDHHLTGPFIGDGMIDKLKQHGILILNHALSLLSSIQLDFDHLLLHH